MSKKSKRDKKIQIFIIYYYTYVLLQKDNDYSETSSHSQKSFDSISNSCHIVNRLPNTRHYGIEGGTFTFLKKNIGTWHHVDTISRSLLWTCHNLWPAQAPDFYCPLGWLVHVFRFINEPSGSSRKNVVDVVTDYIIILVHST